jgi:D-alanyl-D-alanine carboxypeptidase
MIQRLSMLVTKYWKERHFMPQKSRNKKRRRKSGRLFFIFLFCAVLLCGYQLKGILSSDAYGLSVKDEAVQDENAKEGYSLIVMNIPERSQGSLVLVNSEAPYQIPENQKITAVYDEKTGDYFVRDKTVKIDGSIMENLNGMMSGFVDATGKKDVNVVSGYRSYVEQQELYEESLAENGAEYTASFLAQPGCSEHHTGLAVDFSIFHIDSGDSEEFNGTGEYAWFDEHSWSYGFIRRYAEEKAEFTGVSDEPWHFRYVGIPHAYYMMENSLCLEEYIELLRNYPYEGEHLRFGCEGIDYEVYFCQGNDVYVPEGGDYTVSGNNVDGFVVTVTITD